MTPPPLDWPAVAAAVRHQRVGGRFVYLATTGSTNDDARALAQSGEPDGTVVCADAQTAGRGRAGKSPWLTPPRTSVAVSLLLRPPLPAGQLAVLGMAAGVAACDAALAVAGVPCRLKWPNDVLIGPRKLGGILVESALVGARVAYAVVGIGLNVNVDAASLGPFPESAVVPTSLRDAAGTAVSRESVVLALLRSFDRLYAAVRAGETEGVVAAYRARLAVIGEEVRLLAGDDTVEGVAEDVTSEGALVVRLPSGERRVFPYGDVTLRPRGGSQPRRAP